MTYPPEAIRLDGRVATACVSLAAFNLACKRSPETAYVGVYVYTRRRGDAPNRYTQWREVGPYDASGHRHWTARRVECKRIYPAYLVSA